MKVAADKARPLEPEEQSLQKTYEEHYAHWERLKMDIENLRQQLEEVPEKWKHYNQR